MLLNTLYFYDCARPLTVMLMTTTIYSLKRATTCVFLNITAEILLFNLQRYMLVCATS